MYDTVFISHSKDDPNLDFFHKILSALPTEAVWMEFEDMEAPPYLSIRRKVNSSDAIFVLLSEHLVHRQHTNNWVSFEIGLAGNRKSGESEGLDVWVFEPMGEDISFAVPYCTFYVKYKTPLASLKRLKEMLKYKYPANLGIELVCPSDNCRMTFRYLGSSVTHVLNCPACRKDVMAGTRWWVKDVLKRTDDIVKTQLEKDKPKSAES